MPGDLAPGNDVVHVVPQVAGELSLDVELQSMNRGDGITVINSIARSLYHLMIMWM